MKFNTLGKTDIKVSAICLGTMTWGTQNTEAEGHEQIRYALDQGINFLDTAEIYAVPPSAETYGKTESYIGTWLQKNGGRDKLVIASKIAGPGPAWIRNGQNKIDKKNLNLAIEASLKRLQTDYIDLYQLHWPNRPFTAFQNHWNFRADFNPQEVKENFLEVLQTLESLKTQGKIRHFGLSNESAWGTANYIRLAEDNDLPRPVSIQNEYSLLCRLFEPDLGELAMAEECGLLAWSPLARGVLSGKYLNGAMPKGSRLSIDPRPDKRKTPQSDKAIEAYVNLAKKHDLDPAQMALAFVNRQPFVTSNIIGATCMEQLKSNIASLDLELSPEVLSGIDEIYRQYPIPY